MKASVLSALLALTLCALPARSDTASKVGVDWITELPRETIHVKSWPNGKKVAVCFIFFVEHFDFGEGPNFRPDMANRRPDLVDESFRQYAIYWGVDRVGRIFREQSAPMSIALNALFPEEDQELWGKFRKLVPNAPIIAHGMNNTTQLLPLGKGTNEQQIYIEKTLDLIQKNTGVRPLGWSSPSVYADANTFSSCTAAGIRYTLDGMDSDNLTKLITKSGPLVLIPYPTTTVDMGQYLERNQQPHEIERLWLDYVSELVNEAESDPNRDATIVAIGVHPFVFGTPDGALSLRRVLNNLKNQKLVWLTDVQQVMDTIK